MAESSSSSTTTSTTTAGMLFIIVHLMSLTILGKPQPLPCQLPPQVCSKLRTDSVAINLASSDYGNIVHDKPEAVLYPSSIEDISALVKSSYDCSTPFGISIRGNGHSTHGQDMAKSGVVVYMRALRESQNGTRIRVSKDPLFVDVGGEQLWINVLKAAVLEGVAPVSWTDYLGLTVGGTLSNAGISGQTFAFGPQTNNVYELDVITGKGELMTCSPNKNAELFYAVLGGLGQFGIITRARIALGPAPKKVMWLRALYSDFSAFTKDQEKLISLDGRDKSKAVDYVEGSVLLDNGTPNTWETFFYPTTEVPRILSLVKQFGILYVLEVTKALDDDTEKTLDQELEDLLEGLGNLPGLIFRKDVTYEEFLTRVQIVDQNTASHPWINLFIPRSNISDFDSGVWRDIVLQRNITTGPVLMYPMNRNKWDGKMSASTPDEDVFYAASILSFSGLNDWQAFNDQNKAIMQFCDSAGLKVKQYLPNYTTKDEWINHFGSKWSTFEGKKSQFDPKFILSPGQRIFNNERKYESKPLVKVNPNLWSCDSQVNFSCIGRRLRSS